MDKIKSCSCVQWNVIQQLKAGSAFVGELPEGCTRCAEGSKMVLLVTGRCPTGCYYCPLSSEKRGRDVIFANERRIHEHHDIIEEARAIDARGTGITGGDPLAVPERTLGYIRMLREEFGPSHHLHLYTATLDEELFRRLESAGLDELRVHLPPEGWSDETVGNLSRGLSSTSLSLGIEVPSVPGEREWLIEVLDAADDMGLDFVNLNELEFSETNFEQLKDRGFGAKNDLSSAVRGSQELAMEMLRRDLDLSRHYCSSSFKDRVQLRNRIKRRARNVALSLDIVTEEGTLYRGLIETEEPRLVGTMLRDQYGVPDDLVCEDGKKVLLAPWILEEIAKDLPYRCFLIEKYPTADGLEVEREPL